MTRSVGSPRVSYAGTGSSGPFSFPHYVVDSSYVTVALIDSAGASTTLVEGTGYTFSGEGTATGSVTTTDTVDTGETLVIYRTSPQEQSQSLIQGGTFSSATQMAMADRAIDMVQELSTRMDMFLLPLDGYAPDHADNAGKYLKLNENGDGIETAEGVDVSAFVPGINCLVVSTSNITLSGTQSIDGVGVVATNIVLVTGQTVKADNGVYIVAAGAWTRHASYDSTAELQAMTAFGVTSGTTYASTIWVQLVLDPTIGTSDLVFGRLASNVGTANLLIDNGGTINFNSGDVVLTHSSNALAMTGGQLTVTYNGGATSEPLRLVNTTDNASVQVAQFEGDRATMADNDEAYVSLMLSNDAGTQTEFGRLTWVATDVNAGTSVDGRIDFAVVTAGTLADEMQIDGAALSPSTNDGLALGTTSLGWSDLHLATGGVINFANGEITLTETANVLAMAGGSLSVTDSTAAATAPITALNSTNNATVKGITIAGDRSAPANNDAVYAEFQLSDSAGNQTEFGRITVIATDVANGSEDAEMRFSIIEAASLTAELSLTLTALTPVTNDGLALGTTSLMWADGFFASGAVLNFNAGDVTITHSANALAFAGASSGYSFDANLLFASGTALNFNSGDVTITHSANALAFAGATSGYTFDDDLLLPSGGVVNFNSGDVLLTHTANTLTLSGGDLVVPNASADGHALNRVTADGRYFAPGVTGVSASVASTLSANAPINASITSSVSANALTIALKTLAGADASATDVVLLPFRSATAATGTVTWRLVTAATSLTVSNGSTLGTSNSTAFSLWVVAFDDEGTIRLGVVNCLSGTSIMQLQPDVIASSTAEGGIGGADSAQVFYTGTAVTSKPYVVLGRLIWSSGLATAGAWSGDPDVRLTFVPGMKLPGARLQNVGNTDGAVATGTTTSPYDDTIPQNTEGDQFMTQAITPVSAANVLSIVHNGNYASSSATADSMTAALFQDSTANALAVSRGGRAQGANLRAGVTLFHKMLAGTMSPTTLKIRAGQNSAGTTTFNGSAAAREFGGVMASRLDIEEIVA